MDGLIGAILFSQVYELTVADSPGTIYIILAIFSSVVAILFLVLLFMLLWHEKIYGKIEKQTYVSLKSGDQKHQYELGNNDDN